MGKQDSLKRRDIIIGSRDETENKVPVRVYEPGGDPVCGTLLWVHGGGWVSGGIEEDDTLCGVLAARSGIRVISVGYRLAPEHPFPCALEDCGRALAWLCHGAHNLEIDRSRVAIGGESAGGNLAAAAAILLRDRHAETLALQLLVFPALAGPRTPEFASGRAYADGFGNDTADRNRYWKAYVQRDADEISPYSAPLLCTDLHDLPSAFVITAEEDPIRDEAEEYTRRLQRAGVDATCHRIPGARHGIFPEHLNGESLGENPVVLMCEAIASRL